jgi:hypothetical protein
MQKNRAMPGFCVARCRWPGIDKGWPGRQPFQQIGQIGMAFAPVNGRKAEIQIAQAAANGNISQAVAFTIAPLPLPDRMTWRQAPVDFVLLACYPVRHLLVCWAALFQHDGNGSIGNAIGQCFPAPGVDQATVFLRQQAGYREILSRYSTMTRESNKMLPSSSSSTGTLPSGL